MSETGPRKQENHPATNNGQRIKRHLFRASPRALASAAFADNLVVVVRIVGPMHLYAIAFGALLELFKIFRKMGKDVLLGIGSETPKLFPLRDSLRRTIPCDAH